MNRGQPSKMTLKPPMRASPTSTEEEALKRLSALDEWTQEPSKDVAAAITSTGSTALSLTNQAEEKPVKAAKTPVTAFSYPWEGVGQGTDKQINVRIPLELYAKLKWLTGFGNGGGTMIDIVIESLEKTVKKMLADRGIQ